MSNNPSGSLVVVSSEEEQIQDLISWLTKKKETNAPLASLADSAQELGKKIITKEGEAPSPDAQKAIVSLVSSLVDNISVIFTEGSDAEVEIIFNLLFFLLARQQTAQVDKLVQFLSSSPAEKPQLRLKLLSNYYNSLPESSPLRFAAFSTLLQFANSSNNLHLVSSQLNKINDEFIKKQTTQNTEQLRSLLRLIRQISAANGNQLTAYKYAVTLLSTYDKAPAEALASVKKDAATAALEGIKHRDVFQYDDLLRLPAIDQLQNDQSTASLYKLLKIFANETLIALNKFHQENPNFFSENGVSYEESVTKMRLLSLVTLAAEKSEITYSSITQALQISEDEVETWIINAIGAQLIDAKMDQLKKTVDISRSTQRVFSEAQWKDLKTSLVSWKQNLQSILKTIDNASEAVPQKQYHHHQQHHHQQHHHQQHHHQRHHQNRQQGQQRNQELST